MKFLILLILFSAFSIVLGGLTVKSLINVSVDNAVYKCQQDWSGEYEDIQIELKTLELKYTNLEYVCNIEGKG